MNTKNKIEVIVNFKTVFLGGVDMFQKVINTIIIHFNSIKCFNYIYHIEKNIDPANKNIIPKIVQYHLYILKLKNNAIIKQAGTVTNDKYKKAYPLPPSKLETFVIATYKPDKQIPIIGLTKSNKTIVNVMIIFSFFYLIIGF